MSIRCRLGVHNWNKYSSAVTAYGGLTQFRCCDRCNIISWRGFHGNQANYSQVNKALDFNNTNSKGE